MIHFRRILPLLVLLALLPFSGRASEAADAEIDVNEIIFGHLGDSYSWHIITVGEHHIELPLPVIVWGSDKSWHVFSSAHLSHGASWDGFKIAEDGDHAGLLIETASGARPPLDISITKSSLAIMINCCVLLLIILPLARWYRRGRMDAPKGILGMVEVVAEYIYDDVIMPSVGEDYRKYSPYLLAMFFFILVNNLMGLIPIFPAGANITGNIAVTLVLAVATMLVVNFSGTKEYWKEIFWPDVPWWLKAPAPIMPLVELLGVFTKPFALMVRLFANIFAGHAVILGIVCVIFVTVSMGPVGNGSMTAVSIIFGSFMLCLELLVAFIQAYVFTMLSAIFIGMARVKHEHN